MDERVESWHGGDGDYSLDGVNGKSGSCRGINGMVGSYFVPWEISTCLWTIF